MPIIAKKAKRTRNFFPSPEEKESHHQKERDEQRQDAKPELVTPSENKKMNRFSTPTKTKSNTTSRTSSVDSSVVGTSDRNHHRYSSSKRDSAACRSPSPYHRAHSTFGTSPRFTAMTKDGFAIIESPRASPIVNRNTTQEKQRSSSVISNEKSGKSSIVIIPQNNKEFVSTRGGVIGRADRWRVAESVDGYIKKDPKSELLMSNFARSPSNSNSNDTSRQRMNPTGDATPRPTTSATPSSSRNQNHNQSQSQPIKIPNHPSPLNNAQQRKLHIQQVIDIYRQPSQTNTNKTNSAATGDRCSVSVVDVDDESSRITSPMHTARAQYDGPHQQQRQQQPVTQKNSPRVVLFNTSEGETDEHPPKLFVPINSQEKKSGTTIVTPRNETCYSTSSTSATPRPRNTIIPQPSPVTAASSHQNFHRSASAGGASVRSNRSASLRQQRSNSVGQPSSSSSVKRVDSSQFESNSNFEKGFVTNHHVDPRLSSPMYRKQENSPYFYKGPDASTTNTMGRTKRFSVASEFDYQNLDTFFTGWLKNAKETGLYQSSKNQHHQYVSRFEVVGVSAK